MIHVAPSSLNIKTAEVFLPLLDPTARYLAAHGGRGSAKSHFFASLMVEEHLMHPGHRSVCIREVQKSLKDSAKRLIEDYIKKFGLQYHGFKILNDRIETPGDGVIIFMGLADHSAETVKSLEGFDRAWVEEAQTLSKTSLKLLRPTIRKEGSQIWFSWNPRFERDPVDKFFRGEERPTNAVVVESNWSDNPWFPDELEQERLDDLRIDPDSYGHIWDGEYIRAIEGAYYAKQIRQARSENRIGRVAAHPLQTKLAYIDIGGASNKSDAFAMWICQFIGKELRVTKHYEAVGQEINDHVYWLQQNDLQDVHICLPHDGNKTESLHRITWASEFKAAGFNVTILPNTGKGAALRRVQATREVWPNIWMDEEGCDEYGGLKAISWYHEKKDDVRDIGLGPCHDWSSHSSDAFGEMCLDYQRMTKPKKKEKIPYRPGTTSNGWMGS